LTYLLRFSLTRVNGDAPVHEGVTMAKALSVAVIGAAAAIN
jgi:hypothetical protein